MIILSSGRLRISHWGAPSHWWGVDLQRRHFSVKTCAKTKELDPLGGCVLVAPPGSANAEYSLFHCTQDILNIFSTEPVLELTPPLDILRTQIFCEYHTDLSLLMGNFKLQKKDRLTN